jgi:hypothetical protein
MPAISSVISCPGHCLIIRPKFGEFSLQTPWAYIRVRLMEVVLLVGRQTNRVLWLPNALSDRAAGLQKELAWL